MTPALRQRLQALAERHEEVGRLLAQPEALAFLANTLTNKLLHTPSVKLREAAEQGDTELLRAAARLYGCPANDDPPP